MILERRSVPKIHFETVGCNISQIRCDYGFVSIFVVFNIMFLLRHHFLF
jgi:hypothetical protein